MICQKAQEQLPFVAGNLVKDGEVTTDNHHERKQAEDRVVYHNDSVGGCGEEYREDRKKQSANRVRYKQINIESVGKSGQEPKV